MGFFKKKTEDLSGPAFPAKPDHIIAGLGNPGQEYEYSRHNTGFLCLDVVCNKYGAKTDRVKFHALTGSALIAGHSCLLMRPQTFMNNSGLAVGEAASFYKIPPENVIIIFDDTSLPEGTVRIREKGSAGGHNGVKSIIAALGSDQFPRIKIGIGAKPSPDSDLADYVLGRFSEEAQKTEKAAMERAAEALELIVNGDTELAMSRFNG